MPSTLWQFMYNGSGQTSVPIIMPFGEASTYLPSNTLQTTHVVNVRDDFLWSGAKKKSLNGGREEVPYIVLKERRVKTSSYVSQLLYSAGAGVDSIRTIAAYAQGAFSGTDPNLPQTPTDILKNISSLLTVGADKIAQLGSNAITENAATLGQVLAEKLQGIEDDPSFLSDPWLRAYKNLYLTEPTGWTFFMPYFEDEYQDARNSWSEQDSSAAGQFMFKGVTQITQGLSDLFADVTTSFDKNTYQERAKFFNYSTEGSDVTVKFPLINTGDATYDDVVRNWQLIFLLVYNNRPERVNRLLIEPPPIYEVLIPGVKYMPLSVISGISVEMRGSRRRMKLSIPSVIRDAQNTQLVSQATEFTTIIPEAYHVTITLKGLIGDSKNLMYSTIADNSKVRVMDIADLPTTPGGPNLPTFNPLPAKVFTSNRTVAT